MAAPNGAAFANAVAGKPAAQPVATTPARLPAGGPPSASSFANALTQTAPAAATAPASLPHRNFFDKLGGDVTGSIYGLATAPVTLATHLIHDPVGTVEATPAKLKNTAKAFVATEKQEWGPFVHGYIHLAKYYEARLAGDHEAAAREHALYEANRDQFNAQFNEHPLFPLLDLATLATFGGARIAALSKLPENATLADFRAAALRGEYQGPVRTITARSSLDPNVAPTTVRTLPRNAYRAGRMEATDKLLKRVTHPTAPLVGEFARSARAIRNAAEATKQRGLAIPELANWTHAFAHLDKWERAAAQMLPKLPLPADMQRHIEQLRIGGEPEELQQAALLASPRFQKAYLHPSKDVLKAVEAGRALSKAREGLLAGIGEPMDALAESPFRHTRMTRGGKVGPTLGPAEKIGQTVRVIGKKAEGKIAAIDRGRATVFYQRFGRSVTVPLSRLEHVGPVKMHDGGEPTDILAEIQAAGRPEPYYLPDQMDLPPTTRGGLVKFGRPTGTTPPQSDVRQWHGTLFQGGRLALNPDILSPSYLRALTRAHGLDLHDRVREAATPIPKGQGLPAGHTWVRDVRGQHIPFTETHTGEHIERTGQAYPEIHDELGDLTTKNEAEALVEDGHRLAIPQRFADTLRVEQRAARGAVSKFFANATTVWRALVLNLRIPWLENNIVGNTLLTTVRFAGIHGLRAFLGALYETKGALAVREILNLPVTRSHLTAEDILAITPEQSKIGTGIGSQLPEGVTRNWPAAAQKAVKIGGAPFRILPRIDRATEGFLRRVGTETALRRTPEARAALRAMPRQTRSWREAMLKAASDPNVARAASREVNDALGNFLSLSFSEQNYVRQAIPFYAWYREITRVLLKIPLDTPGRAAILARLGAAGAGPATAGFPSFLAGDIAVGGLDPQGRQTILALQQMNPYTTPIQLAKALKVLVSPNRTSGYQAQGLFNPFIALLSQQINAAASGDASAQGVLQAFYHDFLLGLPEARIAANPPSKLYPGRTRTDLAEQFFGDPRRKISPQVAAQYKAEGR